VSVPEPVEPLEVGDIPEREETPESNKDVAYAEAFATIIHNQGVLSDQLRVLSEQVEPEPVKKPEKRRKKRKKVKKEVSE
jgi:hypothetical protein